MQGPKFEEPTLLKPVPTTASDHADARARVLGLTASDSTMDPEVAKLAMKLEDEALSAGLFTRCPEL